MKKRTLAEIMDDLGIPPIMKDLNNFHVHFLPEHRQELQMIGRWSDKDTKARDKGFSEMRSNQSSEEFYKTLDEITEKVSGGSVSDFLIKLRELLTLRNNTCSKEGRESAANKSAELLLPVREALYQKGYIWNDLCR